MSGTGVSISIQNNSSNCVSSLTTSAAHSPQKEDSSKLNTPRKPLKILGKFNSNRFK